MSPQFKSPQSKRHRLRFVPGSSIVYNLAKGGGLEYNCTTLTAASFPVLDFEVLTRLFKTLFIGGPGTEDRSDEHLHMEGQLIDKSLASLIVRTMPCMVSPQTRHVTLDSLKVQRGYVGASSEKSVSHGARLDILTERVPIAFRRGKPAEYPRFRQNGR